MSRAPAGQAVRTLDDAVAALLDEIKLGLDSYLLDGLAAGHRNTLRAAGDRTRRRADALAAADRKVAS